MYVYITAKCIHTHNTHTHTHTHTLHIYLIVAPARLYSRRILAQNGAYWLYRGASSLLTRAKNAVICELSRISSQLVPLSTFVTEASWPTRVEKCGAKAGERRVPWCTQVQDYGSGTHQDLRRDTGTPGQVLARENRFLWLAPTCCAKCSIALLLQCLPLPASLPTCVRVIWEQEREIEQAGEG